MSYVRVSIQGTLAGGEVWSVNPVFDPNGEFGSTVDQAALDAAAADIVALSPSAELIAIMSSAMTLTSCKLEVRNDVGDGLIGISEAARAIPLVGTGAPKMPPQAAAVISLRTNTPGASGRGRVYWPAMGVTVTATGRFAAVETAAIAEGFRAYLNLIRGALADNFPTVGFDAAVRSKTTQTTPHVVRLQVGDVVDTQRRRRDRLAESYSTLPVP